MRSTEKTNPEFRSSIQKIQRMFSFLKGISLPYAAGLLLVSNFYLLSSLFNGALYGMVASVGTSDTEQIPWNFLFLFASFLALILIRAVGIICFQRSSARGDEALRQTLSKKLIHMPLLLWNTRHSGDWLAILGKDADDASDIYKEKASYIISSVLCILGGLLVLLLVSPAMAVCSFGIGLSCIWFGFLKWKRSHDFQQKIRNAGGLISAHFSNQIHGCLISRFYHLESILNSRLEDALSETQTNGMGNARILAFNGVLSQVSYTLSYSGMLIVGLILVERGALTLPAMLALWPLSVNVSFGIQDMAFFYTELQEIITAIERLEQVLDLPQESTGSVTQKALECADSSTAAIQMEHVTFSYPGKSPALSDFSLTIKQGERIAFVGESGSGKTTLARLLMGLYPAEQGTISVLGEPVTEENLSSIRKQIAYVPQMPHLLDDTIRLNISLGKPDCTDGELVYASKKAGADAFISALPHAYDTRTGPDGSNLSGGQCQRIAIARAFLKDAPIFIFDEATASLDGQTETRIHDVFRHMEQKKTLLLITHRLSTALLADRIIVLDHGRIVESGAHQSLLEKDGYYRRLWTVSQEHPSQASNG